MNLDERTLRLIALGASVSANCQPCLQTNLARAIEAQVGAAEIAEALEVGKMVRRGAASKMDRFISELKPGGAALADIAEGGCGCSPSFREESREEEGR